MLNKETCIDFIEGIRVKRKMSVRKLARESKRHYAHFYKFLRKESVPSWEAIFAMFDGLGFDLEIVLKDRNSVKGKKDEMLDELDK